MSKKILSRRDDSQSLFITQYTQCYEHLRHHDRLILQAPSIAIVIDGAILISTFAFVPIWWVREVILVVALALTIGLIILLTKTLYHIRVEKNTLTSMEIEAGQKIVHRTTKPERLNLSHYWYYIPPKHIQRFSAAEIFISLMCFLVLLIIILLVLNGIFLREFPAFDKSSSSIPFLLI